MGQNWTAIILAGQRPGPDAFADSHGVAAKALIPVAGVPMLGRVARALLDSPSVVRIVVLAQEPEALMQGELAWLAREPRISSAIAGAGISTSIQAVAGNAQTPWPVLIVTADHALLTPEMVEAFIARTRDTDVALAVVERKLVEAAYPETRRTWIKFSDGDYTGANLFALFDPESRKALEIWAQVEQDRKKAMRLLMFFGPMLALRALTRTISLDGAVRRIGRKAKVRVQAVRMPIAEAAIDVDKPSDLVMVETILARQAAAA